MPVRVYQDLRTSDIAVLKIDPGHRLFGYTPLIFGDRNSYERGDRITAIGYPDAADTFSDLTIAQFTDSTTLHGSIARITTVDGVPVIQTDTNITGGHSGGPIINEDGYVIGIGAAVLLAIVLAVVLTRGKKAAPAAAPAPRAGVSPAPLSAQTQKEARASAQQAHFGRHASYKGEARRAKSLFWKIHHLMELFYLPTKSWNRVNRTT